MTATRVPTDGLSHRIVYLLADAHESLSAQKDLARRIKALRRAYGIQTVAFEGASGPVTGQAFKEGASLKSIRKASNYFLRQGRIGAAEYAYLITRHEFHLIGVEDKKAYLEDLNDFRKLLGHQEHFFKIWNNIKRIFNHPDRAFPRSRKKQRVERLILELDSSRHDPVAWLKSIDPLIRAGRLNLDAFPNYRALRSLMELMETRKNSLTPDAIRKRQAMIRGGGLARELDQLVWSLREAISDSEPERRWVRFRRNLELARKLCLGQIVPEEYEALAHETSPVSGMKDFLALFSRSHQKNLYHFFRLLDPIIQSAEKFYDGAHVRSRVMGQNTLAYLNRSGEEKIILVTGGFHVPVLKQYFNEQNIQCHVITPRIPEQDFRINYQKNMKQGHRPALVRRIEASQIRLDSPLKPIEFPQERARFLKEFREKTGVRDEHIFNLRNQEWLRAASLGNGTAGQTIQLPASLDQVFSGFLTGKTFLQENGEPLFRAKIPGRLYLIHPSLPGGLKEALLSMFRDPIVKDLMAQEIKEKLIDGFFLDENSREVPVDILLWLFSALAEKPDIIHLEDMLAKMDRLSAALELGKAPMRLETSKGDFILTGFDSSGKFVFSPHREFWEEFFANKVLFRLFAERIGRQSFEEDVILEEVPRGADWESVVREIKARLSGEAVFIRKMSHLNTTSLPATWLEFYRIHTKSGLAKEKVLEVLSGLKQEIAELVKAMKQMNPTSVQLDQSERPNVLELLEEWTERFGNTSLAQNALSHVLKHLRLGYPVRVGGSAPLQGNRQQEFLLSRVAQVFQSDSEGNVINADQVFAAFVMRQIREGAHRILSGKETPENRDRRAIVRKFIEHFSFSEILSDREMLERAWNLYFPATRVQNEHLPAGSVKWELSFATRKIPAEPDQPEPEQLLGALLARGPDVFGPGAGSYANYHYYYVASGGKISVNPFLILQNPNSPGALFRIENPDTAKVTARLVEDVRERQLVAGWLIAQLHHDGESRMRAWRMAIDLLDSGSPDSLSEDWESPFVERVLAKYLRDEFTSRIPPNRSTNINYQGVSQEVLDRKVVPPKEFKLTFFFKDRNIRLEISPYRLWFEHVTPNSYVPLANYSRDEILSAPEEYRWSILAAFQYLLSGPLDADEQIIFERWEPFVLKLWQNVTAKGKSLGAGSRAHFELSADEDREMIQILSRGLTRWEAFPKEDRLIRQILQSAEGPYELFVFWRALPRGIFVDQLARLLGQIPNLRITIVDDVLTGAQIKNKLRQMDPQGWLTRYRIENRLVIPDHPKLKIHLDKAQARLAQKYQDEYDSFLGVVFSDIGSEGNAVTASEMIAQAPRAQRFLVQGKVSLGAIARAVFALVSGKPSEYFDSTFQDRAIWTLLPTPEEFLSTLDAARLTQLKLQMSA